jgi:hypothetical protein
MRVLRARRGRDEAAVDCGRRKFATARKGSTIRLEGAQLGRAGQVWGTGKSRRGMTVSPPPSHEIVLVPFGREELRQECYNVRINVFHHEQGFPLEAEIDELRLIWPAAPAAAIAPLIVWVMGYAYFRAFTQTRRDG